ncbi:hypothetical protein [Oligoflexus tunisiensis]|uniref:hypothetical protein n=1 Tax=Oligoflexus tunisiensis TaxID=708132 RepID=UPI00114CF6A3|nr:hypothetical protein [Oligoflexus tunisiensis]
MKAVLATALLATLTASSALAEVQVETRAFHTNLRLDSEEVIYVADGLGKDTFTMNEDHFNTAGFGIAAVNAIDDTLEFGLGLSFARYYPTTKVQIDQTILNAFTRINLAKTETGKVFILGGLSRQQLAQEFDDEQLGTTEGRYTPIVNGDVGLGGSLNLGGADLGLEYKYSSTVASGRASIRNNYNGQGFALTGTRRDKMKVKGVVLEGQEIALTLGMKI